MKILRMMWTRDSFHALPAAKQTELQAAAFAFINKYTKAGKLQSYFATDLLSGFALWEVESLEELARYAMEYPLTPYSDHETYPLVEAEAVEKMWKESQAAAQKKAPAKVPVMSR